MPYYYDKKSKVARFTEVPINSEGQKQNDPKTAIIHFSDRTTQEVDARLGRYIMSQKMDKSIKDNELIEIVMGKVWKEKREIKSFDFTDRSQTENASGYKIETKEEYDARIFAMGDEKRARYFVENWVQMLFYARGNTGKIGGNLLSEISLTIYNWIKNNPKEAHVPREVYNHLVPVPEPKYKSVGRWQSIGELLANK